MANRFARKAGNWDAADVWSDTPSGAAGAEFVPGAGDVAHANSFAITINVNATCSQVRTDNANGATTAGTFTINDGITLTADVIAGTGIAVTLASGSATIVGNVTGGTSTNIFGCRNTGTGTLTITGNVTGGTSAGAHGAFNDSTGTLAITGDVTGGSSATTAGVYADAAGIVTIDGDVLAATGNGARNGSSGTLSITGDVYGSDTAYKGGVNNESTGIVTVDGAVYCGLAGPGIEGVGLGAIVVGGPCYRKSTADGGNSYLQPISASCWAFKSASTMQYEVGLHNSGALVTFAPTEAVLTVSADTLTRLAVCATVDSTGAQIAALGPTE